MKILYLLFGLFLSQVAHCTVEKPTVALIPFMNETGGQVISVAPGEYQEKIVDDGNDSIDEEMEEDGKRVSTSHSRKSFRTLLSKKIRYEAEGCKLPDNACIIASSIASDILISSQKYHVLNRLPLEVEKWEKQRKADRLVDDMPLSAWKSLRSVGADYLLTGTLIDFRVSEFSGTAYGVTIRQVHTDLTLKLALINTSTSEIVASKIETEKTIFNIPDGMTKVGNIYNPNQVIQKAIVSAMGKIFQDLEQEKKNELANDTKHPNVEIYVDSIPQGASVEFNGKYYGSTPCSIALPILSGELIISTTQGEWKRTITPHEGLKLSAVLSTRNVPKK
ncbi:MAG: PEGA domain-containing protein [Akkermansia sp.]